MKILDVLIFCVALIGFFSCDEKEPEGPKILTP
jgi:hypothetical protein